MTRSGLEDNVADHLKIHSATFPLTRVTLSDDLTIPSRSNLFWFLDAGGSNRDITLPALGKGGKFVGISNVGASGNLVVKNVVGTTVLTLAVGEGAIFVGSTIDWQYYTNTSGAPEATTMTSTGVTISINKVGDNFDIDTIDTAIDHDSLLNFVADEHVAHGGVTLTAGIGLAGGGTIAANRTFDLDINSLDADTPVLADTFAFEDIGGGDDNKATLTILNSILDHDALLNFVAGEHIDHTGVSVTAGTGLSGGGTIDATRTINLDIDSLAADTPIADDTFAFHDADGGDENKVTLTDLITALGISGFQTRGDVLDDLNTLGAAASDGEFLVATGAGVFTYESGATARASLDIISATTSDEGLSEHGTTAEYRANSSDIRVLESNQVWDAMAEVTLTDAAPIVFNATLGIDFTVMLSGNRTLQNVSGTAIIGKKGRIRVVQDGDGARTLAFGTDYEFGDETPPTVSVGTDAPFTVTIASPGVLTFTAHGFSNGDIVVLATSGADLPTGLEVLTEYFVVGKTDNTFKLALTKGGSDINTSGSQSGTHNVCGAAQTFLYYDIVSAERCVISTLTNVGAP